MQARLSPCGNGAVARPGVAAQHKDDPGVGDDGIEREYRTLTALPEADSLIRGLLPAVLEAARVQMRHFASGVTVMSKPDASPVTAADHESEGVLLAGLERVAPNIPVIAEEQAAAGRLPPPQGRFFLVDALDGTRYFIKGKPEFSINVALVDAGAPVFGLIYVPPAGRLYVTRSDGSARGAVLMPQSGPPRDLDDLAMRRLKSRDPDRSALVAFNSRNSASASAALLAELEVKEARPLGSSEKFCLIAAGEGDLYARLGPTYEWDTAAGQAILEAAGGSVTRLDGARLTYGKSQEGYLNPAFVAWGGLPLLTRA